MQKNEIDDRKTYFFPASPSSSPFSLSPSLSPSPFRLLSPMSAEVSSTSNSVSPVSPIRQFFPSEEPGIDIHVPQVKRPWARQYQSNRLRIPTKNSPRKISRPTPQRAQQQLQQGQKQQQEMELQQQEREKECFQQLSNLDTK